MKSICSKCLHLNSCVIRNSSDAPSEMCVTACFRFDAKPKTNADRIRSMSESELAEFINNCINGEFWRVQVGVKTQNKRDWLNWLRKEADQKME